jgi:sec-independent protein translocase protein TatA
MLMHELPELLVMPAHPHFVVSKAMFSVPELLILLVICLVLFGANKLPGVGDALGRSIRNFKRASAADDGEEEPAPAKGAAKAVAAGQPAKQIEEGATAKAGDDEEWEEVVVRRRKKKDAAEG